MNYTKKRYKKKHANKPVGEMSIINGELSAFQATVASEMSVEDVPLAPWADLAELTKGDTDPFPVVVAVPTGKSKRGWNYQAKSLQDIVGEVMAEGLPGFRGHQKPENIDSEFPDPATHWVGAKFDPEAPVKDKDGNVIGKGIAYFRGVVDKAQADLKRWLRSKVIRQVSIYGFPKLQKVKGETNVVGYKALSIDWTPLNRSGMPTQIVAMGEIDVIGEFDGTHEELKTLLKNAVIAKMGIAVTGPNSDYLWVPNVWDDHVVVEHESKGITKYYDFPYSVLDGVVTLGDKKEVVPKRVYEPVGEMNNGGGNMDFKELCAKLKAMVQSGVVTTQQICGEMGWTAEQLAKALDPDWVNKANGEMSVMGEIRKTVTGDKPAEAIAQTFDVLGKVKTALGVTGEMDVVAVATEAAKAVTAQKKAGFTAMVDGVIKEKVAGEMAQKLIGRMLNVAEGATKEQIAGEIDTLLADETIKATIAGMHIDNPPPVGGAGSGSGTGALRKRTSSI